MGAIQKPEQTQGDGQTPPTHSSMGQEDTSHCHPVRGLPGPGDIASTSASLQVGASSFLRGKGHLSTASAAWTRVLGLENAGRGKGRQVEGQSHSSYFWGLEII